MLFSGTKKKLNRVFYRRKKMENVYRKENSLTPGIFFKQCGLKEIYVYREGGMYNGIIPLCDLDDRMRNKGSARVLRGFTKTGKAMRIVLRDQTQNIYVCEWITFDYIRGEFFIGVSKNTSRKIIFLSMCDMSQMSRVRRKKQSFLYSPPA